MTIGSIMMLVKVTIDFFVVFYKHIHISPTKKYIDIQVGSFSGCFPKQNIYICSNFRAKYKQKGGKVHYS